MLSPNICRPGQLVGVLSWSDRQVIVPVSYVLGFEVEDKRAYAILACGLSVSTKCLVPVDPSVN